MDPNVARAIEQACDEVIADGHAEHFPIDMFQGGAGTSTNMNMNEVLANRALQILGLALGRYDTVHPNDHVNRSQSTNDVYPTALRMAVRADARQLRRALEGLAEAFDRKSNEFEPILKLGRTQLQDAVPMTLGQEFGAFATTIREDILRLDEAARLLSEVNLGGTAIGTGIAADPSFRRLVLEELNAAGASLVPAENLIEASWDAGAFVTFSGMLKRVAVKLSKIANDLRLLSSGPRGGFGEIHLPQMQAGSSIMPGKVNPVIPEVVNQVAFQVIGQDMTVTMAAEAGQLQLNAMEPVIGFNLLWSLRLLRNAVDALSELCVSGIRADQEACKRHLDESTALATALIPTIGYDAASKLAKDSLRTGRSVRELYAEAGGRVDVLNALADAQSHSRGGRIR
jgi:aspartate ammonia-lyase